MFLVHQNVHTALFGGAVVSKQAFVDGRQRDGDGGREGADSWPLHRIKYPQSV